MSKYKEDLLATELEPIGEYVPLLDVIYVIPTRRKHDSGYMCMKFALTYHDEVIGCVGGGSDVIHLNGIGGYGKIYGDISKRQDWSIDCLKNGLLRVFSCTHKLEIDRIICSDFCVYMGEEK